MNRPIPMSLFIILMALMVCTIWSTAIQIVDYFEGGTRVQVDQVKIECILHRENLDVHKLCVDHGYDH